MCHVFLLCTRQRNWRLDPPLRKACKADVASLCVDEDKRREESGVVIKCMLRRFDDLSEGCQKELSRSVHMAFYVWAPKGLITGVCDDDIAKLCLKKDRDMAKRPGAVGDCIAQLVSADTGCRRSCVRTACLGRPFFTSFPQYC